MLIDPWNVLYLIELYLIEQNFCRTLPSDFNYDERNLARKITAVLEQCATSMSFGFTQAE